MAKKTYAKLDVVATAIAVDEAQGFIKSGYGYYDFDKELNVLDNKTACIQLLNNDPHAPTIEVTEAHREEATELVDYFDSLIVMKKVTGSVTGFEDTVGKILNNDKIDNYGLSVIASLPNSLRIQKQRDDMDDFYEELRPNCDFVGEINTRGKFKVFIKDVKYIAKYGIHLVTGVVDEKNLIKFFWNKEPDISNILTGNVLMVTGFVKEQSVSKFSKCKETVINRVKIEKST